VLVEVQQVERKNTFLLPPRQLAPAARVLHRRREGDCGGDDGFHYVHHDGGDNVNAVCAASAPVAGALTHPTRNHRAQSEASVH
jgi:hypothetical protein